MNALREWLWQHPGALGVMFGLILSKAIRWAVGVGGDHPLRDIFLTVVIVGGGIAVFDLIKRRLACRNLAKQRPIHRSTK